jgi:anti-sigma factor RsiW
MKGRTHREARMSCMRVVRVLQSYLDGEVDEATARRVAAHLEVCRRCGMSADSYRAIKASLARRQVWDHQTRRRLEIFARQVGAESSSRP